MGRKRTRVPLDRRGDRIHFTELRSWMFANDLSPHTLAKELSLKYSTIEGWLRGYRHPPEWLEARINYAAALANPKLPPYGKHWPK